MQNRWPFNIAATVVMLTLAVTIALPSGAVAEPPADMAGWQIDSPYNQLYDARELDSFKGYV